MDRYLKGESQDNSLSSECHGMRKECIVSEEDALEAAEFNAMIDETGARESYLEDHESDVWLLAGDLNPEDDCSAHGTETLPEMDIIIENLYIC